MSVIVSRVKKNAYYDSVRLMRVATTVQAAAGVLDCAIMVGTERNKEFLKGSRLLTQAVQQATSNDVYFVVEAESPEAAEKALALSESILEGTSGKPSPGRATAYSLESALAMVPANIALLSIPGMYVKREAMKCLERGLHLFIFSDNVPLGDELEIKQKASELGLLVMGPDCGTAILNNAALGFANRVRTGPIGLVGASGTGIQEIACLVHHLGLGVSQAIGTGSHDVSREIGGITMLRAIQMLAGDPHTRVIVVISKPPSPEVFGKVVEALVKLEKPAVVNFIGEHPRKTEGSIHFAEDMEQAAATAVTLAGSEPAGFLKEALTNESLLSAAGKLGKERKFVRGVFSGGTFAVESALILSRLLGKVHTNVAAGERLPDARFSKEHTCVDLGDDLFTAGRPHPMLEPAVRNRRIQAEMEDPSTAAVLLDVVLGYGVHRDPAGELISGIGEAQERSVQVVASVCGTDEDPQSRSRQAAKLRDAGVLVFPSNASASRAAAFIAARGKLP
jgi:FdrA protein